MSRSCCQITRRGRAMAGWVIPSATLALLPKCPGCIVGYVAIATGMGISLTAAKYLRFGLIGLCIGVLGWFAARWVARGGWWGKPGPTSEGQHRG